MPTRDYRDLLGGCALLIIGSVAAIYSLMTLHLGTLSRMGPGMFPTSLGVILAVFGLILLVQAMFRTGEMPRGDLRSFLAICTSIFAFAVMIRPFGLLPAIVALTFIASRADGKLSLKGTAILAGLLSAGSFLIFRTGLDLPITLFAWPW